MKRTTLLFSMLLFALVGANADHWTEDFEDQSISGYVQDFTCTISGTWTANNAGNTTLGSAKSGSKSIAINDDIPGAYLTSPSLSTLGTVSFYYYQRNGSSTDVFAFQISEDGGDFITVKEQSYGDVFSYTLFTCDVNSSSSDIKVRILNDDMSGHLIIDDFTVSDYATDAVPVFSALFTADVSDIYVGDSVTFIPELTNGKAPYTYSWDFDGDDAYDAVVENPTYTYTAAGTYSVTLKVTDANAEELVVSETVFITVSDVPTAMTTTLPYLEGFSTDFGNCIDVDVAGDKSWYIADEAAACNAYEGDDPEEHWLILPAVNFDNYVREVITFETENQYGANDEGNYLKLVYSTDYDGFSNRATATWVELSADVLEASNTIDLSTLVGTNVSLAFKYYSTNAPGLWKIDNIKIDEAPIPVPVFTHILPVSGSVFDLGVTIPMSVTAKMSDDSAIDGVSFWFGASADALDNEEPLIKDGDVFSSNSLNLNAVGAFYGKLVATLGTDSVGESELFILEGQCPVIAAPIADAASNITTDSFSASWTAVEGAEKYVFCVWTEEGSEAVELVNETFKDGTETFPSDWACNEKIYDTNDGDLSEGLRLGSIAAPGEIISPLFTADEDVSVVFYAKQYNETENVMTVEYDNQLEAVTLGAEWAEYTVKFTTTYKEQSVKFSAQRAHLGDVIIKSGGFIKSTVDSLDIIGATHCVAMDLDASMDYKFSVKAVNIYGCIGDASESIAVKTAGSASVHVPKVLLDVYATTLGIRVHTSGSQTVSVYDVAGRSVVSHVVVDYETISVPQGIYLVEVANEIVKVVVR